MRSIAIFIGMLLLAGCNEERTRAVEEPAGTMFAISDHSLEEAYSNLLGSLNENQDISVITEVDFEANARELQRDSHPVRTVFFGNPQVGTLLMQQDQLAALELPQRIVFFEQEGDVYAMYNSRRYLESRYRLEGNAAIQNMNGSMEELVTRATGAKPMQSPHQGVALNQGIISRDSEGNFEVTYRRLKQALLENPNWRVIMELDHSENAAKAGLSLRPTRLILLSNPYLQTNMLENNPTAALDFPHKILVWEDLDGTVRISYNDPAYLQERHKILGSDIELEEIATAFSHITSYAIQDVEAYDAPEGVETEF